MYGGVTGKAGDSLPMFITRRLRRGWLAAGRYLAIAHGPAGEVARAKRILQEVGLGAAVESGRP